MSGSSRDSLFPATSIGRSHGQHIQRSASPSPSLREPLATHPLLSPSPSSTFSPTTTTTTTTTSEPDPTSNQYPTTTRYVPYIPKHRVSSIPTTGTTNHSPLSISTQPHHGDATSKLQVMNLKAAAQHIGLDTASVGWAMLEKLIHENDHTPEWNEIWHALSVDKATLLLPLEPNTEVVTAELIKSHVVFCDNLASVTSSISPLVTLSGLRASLSGDQLVFRSSVHSSSKVYDKILTPTTRSTGLASLPPLSATTHIYPTFTLNHTDSGSSHLLLPPRPPSIRKPPLPPRPSTLAKPSGPSPTSIQSRLGNPFASLFGSKQTTSTSTSSSVAPTDSPATSISTLPDETSDHPIEIQVYTIDKRIQFPVVAKAVCKGLREEVKNSLSDNKSSGLSSWLVNMVVEWLEKSFFPFIKNKPSRTSGEVYIVNEFAFEAEEISSTVQGFYGDIADAVVKRLRRASKLRRHTSSHTPGIGIDRASLVSATEEEISESDKEKFRTSPVITEQTEEERVRQMTESVEGTICDLFYDRLFIPSNSDDLSHDEALSSRIAALNLLDLSLENLGVEIDPSVADEMMDVMKACGDTLTQLDSADYRRPAQKSALLVKAHKIIVEELSKLPPVTLRAETEEPGPSIGSKSPAPSPLTLHIRELEPLPPAEPKTPTMNTGNNGHSTTASPTSDLEQAQVSPLDGSHPPDEPKPFKPTPVSGDVILPLMIYSVVKSNPPRLLSHLLYTQRFRNESLGGEESYCLINLLAAAEFLENVDLAALGLQAEGVNTSDLTPLPVARSRSASVGSVDATPPTPTTTNSKLGTATRLRGRVEQQVDAIAGSANKVLSGVVDSSFGVLRALLPGSHPEQSASQPPEVIVQEQKPGFGLLKKDAGFSIANLAAALPIARQRSNQSSTTVDESSGQQMMEVSRPGSRVSGHSRVDGVGEDIYESSEESEENSEDEADEEEDEEHDRRSIKSFESMMSQRKRRRRKAATGRKSLADRLANVPGLQKLSHAHESKSSFDAKFVSTNMAKDSLIPAIQRNGNETPSSSRAPSPIPVRIAPPVQRFLECSEDDLRVSEIRDLLREYRRVVEGMRTLGGFQE